jgi:hypothetical protein
MRRLLFLLLLAGSLAAQTRFDASSQLALTVSNDGTTGTTLSQLAKANSSGNAVNAGTADTGIPVFVVVGGAGTAGNAQLAVAGAVICKFDASGGTAGHYVQASTATAGRCMDAGATVPTSGWIVGSLLTSPAANANGTVLLVQGFLPSTGGGGVSSVSGTANQIASTGGSTPVLSIANPFIFPGEGTFAAATTGAASANIPSGTAPTTPTAGDLWRDSGGFEFFDASATNGAMDVVSNNAGAVGPANTVRFTGDSNVAKVSENGGALQELMQLTKSQSPTNKTFDSTSTGPWLPLLGCASLASPGTTLGPVTVSGLKIFVAIYIAGYAGGDAASLQFNGSGGTAYRYRWLTSAAGGTTFSAGLVAASTDRIKIGAATTTNSRNVDAIINNSSAVTEKLVMFINGQFGTGSAATQSTLDMGNGAWVSGASTTITSISIISTSNMLAGSKFCAYQAVP